MFLVPNSISCLLVVGLAACQAAAPERAPLEGAWQMVSGRYTTPDTTVEVTTPQIKLLTESHFAFGRPNEIGAFAGGGRYTFDGTTYREIVEYHSDSLAADTTLVFEARLEGDSLWHHSGTIGPNFRLVEVWRRVE